MNFDRKMREMGIEHARASRTIRLGMGWFALAWVISAIAGLALTCGIIYVVLHFVAKFW